MIRNAAAYDDDFYAWTQERFYPRVRLSSPSWLKSSLRRMQKRVSMPQMKPDCH